MALSPSLQQFKSSGVYRLEFDRSQIINIPSETIRLIIGFSKKGPFNTPVFVQDTVFFKQVFGDADPVLERKGSFFHRTVLTCLDRGPVIVLNLLSLDDTLDTSSYQSISTSAFDENSPADTAPVSKYFNTDKFWFTDPNALISAADTYQSVAARRLVNFANVSRKPISIITKKSDLLGFELTAKDWFSAGQVPDFMNDSDYISDYLIDVIVIEGDFSNYTSLSIDPIFGDYFDTTGLKKTVQDIYGNDKDGLTQFLSLPQVNVLGVYSGSLIPEFQDKNGNNIFVQDLVNLETSKTGALMAVNQEAFDNQPYEMGLSSRYISGDLVDTVGHTIEGNSSISILNFMSYYGTIVDEYDYSSKSGATSVLMNTIIAGATPGIVANALLEASTSLQGGTGWTSAGATGYFDTLTIYGPASSALPASYTSIFTSQTQFESFAESIVAGKSFIKGTVKASAGATGDVNYIAVKTKTLNLTNNTLKLAIDLVTSDSTVVGPTSTDLGWYYVGGAGVTFGGGTSTMNIIRSNDWQFTETTDDILFVGQESGVYQANLSGILTDGDKISLTGSTAVGASYGYVEFIRYSTNDLSGSTFSSGAFAGEVPKLSKSVNYATVTAYTYPGLTGATPISATSTYAFKTLTGSINESLEVDTINTPSNPTNVLYFNNTSTGPRGASGFSGKVIKGDYLVQNFGGTGTPTKVSPITGKSRLTKVISVVEISDPTSSLYGYIKVTTNDPIFIDTAAGGAEVERYKDIRNFIDHYRFSTLGGYTLRDAQMPNGTADRQAQILDVLYSTNLSTALVDREVITYRYIVDSFEGVIEPSSKFRLSKLAKTQQSSLAICNMPSVKQFKDSTNPLFKFDSTSAFNTQYIPSGGNLDLAPSNVFGLPAIADGANYSAFYGPNLIIRENGKNTSVPPAAYVSNLYIDKYNLALPYSIVAGPRRGVVSGKGLVGVEFNFDRTDLDFIEPFGYNAIVNKRGFGLTINANQTAQQTIKSALSQIHVRELIIYIQDGVEAILKNYRWEFNTAQNRLEIKTLADNFLSQILADGGVYDYQNIMDTTNNTPEIIDSNIGILDTYIEPVRGMGILVHRTTILKTGTIATGNFL
jgi:hypothetical protein